MRIGFIGLGIMGEAMCYNIIRKHDGDVYIYDVKTDSGWRKKVVSPVTVPLMQQNIRM